MRKRPPPQNHHRALGGVSYEQGTPVQSDFLVQATSQPHNLNSVKSPRIRSNAGGLNILSRQPCSILAAVSYPLYQIGSARSAKSDPLYQTGSTRLALNDQLYQIGPTKSALPDCLHQNRSTILALPDPQPRLVLTTAPYPCNRVLSWQLRPIQTPRPILATASYRDNRVLSWQPRPILATASYPG